jgi:polysaccharide biosynthesis protein PslH
VLMQHPKLRLTVIGRGDNGVTYETLKMHSNIDFVGEVEEVVSWYHKSGIAIVPLLQGSGTRLKLLEAMSLGNPVVSTSIGAEGIVYTPGEHLMIGDTPEAFAGCITELHKNEVYCNQLRKRARQLAVQQYDWEVIGKNLGIKCKKVE